jgi:hypothetical protein
MGVRIPNAKGALPYLRYCACFAAPIVPVGHQMTSALS